MSTSFEREFAAELNARDRAAIDVLTNQQDHVYNEFLRMADLHDVSPEPIPHIHSEHEEKRSLCLWTAYGALPLGMAAAIFLTGGSTRNWVVGALLGGCAFLVLEWLVELLIVSAVPIRRYPELFYRLYWPPALLALICCGILVAARLASQTLADAILSSLAYIWCGIELGFLSVGAVAKVGVRRFGWSSSLCFQYRNIEQEIRKLNDAISRRSLMMRISAPCLLIGLLLIPGHLSAQVVMIDRTGSVADQKAVEEQLADYLSVYVNAEIPLELVPFSSHVLSVPSVRVEAQERSYDGDVIFRPLQNAREQRALAARRKTIDRILAVREDPALCTSIPDVLTRAISQPGPVLLLTDAVHDCSPAAWPHSERSRLIVVLCRSKRDRVNEAQLIEQRQAKIRSVLPNSRIFFQFQMETAVKIFASEIRNCPGISKYVHSPN